MVIGTMIGWWALVATIFCVVFSILWCSECRETKQLRKYSSELWDRIKSCESKNTSLARELLQERETNATLAVNHKHLQEAYDCIAGIDSTACELIGLVHGWDELERQQNAAKKEQSE